MESEENFEKNIKKCITKNQIASNLEIAVITACGSIGTEINIIKLFKFYIRHLCTIKLDETKKYKFKDTKVNTMVKYFEKKIILKYTINGKDVELKYGKKNTFYNCLNVKYDFVDNKGIKSTIASKIFPNGSISIPGCRTINAVYNAPNFLYEILSKIIDRYKIYNNDTILKNPSKFKISKIRIVMINSNFTFNKNILQEKLKDKINLNKFDGKNNNSWRVANFQPENYSGVNIRYLTKNSRDKYKNKFINCDYVPYKIDGQVSIFVFKSGKGTIAGASNTQDLLEAYNAITEFIKNNNDIQI